MGGAENIYISIIDEIEKCIHGYIDWREIQQCRMT